MNGNTEKRDRRLKDQFINGIVNDDVMIEIIRELTILKTMNDITSEQVQNWAKRVEAQ